MPVIKGLNCFPSAEYRQLPTHLVVRTKPTTHRLDLLEDLLRRVGKIQLAIFAVGIPLLAIFDILEAFPLSFGDFLSLSFIGIAGLLSVTAHSSISFSVQKQEPLGLKLLSGVLQFLWLVSELSLNTPLSKLTAHFFPLERSSIAIKIIPLISMFGISVVLHQISNLRNRMLRRHSSSMPLMNESSECDGSAVDMNQIWEQISTHDSGANLVDDSSPHDSFSSDSSGALSTGLPSPTGFCRDEHDQGLEKAYIAAMKTKLEHDDAVYLYKYEILSQEEGMEYFFVHKKLSPIKTKIEDTRQANYRPLLRTLIQQSKNKHQNIPAVRNVAKDRMDGMCMVPSN